jgi:hypothetical protein
LAEPLRVVLVFFEAEQFDFVAEAACALCRAGEIFLVAERSAEFA